jgi:hypothetical protein
MVPRFFAYYNDAPSTKRAFGARKFEKNGSPKLTKLFPRQKLQKAGFISVRDVKAARGPIALARGEPQNFLFCRRAPLT